MKQVAQFKLTGIERIAGLHLEKQKNQRRLLRGRGIEPVFTTALPTPSPKAFDFVEIIDKPFNWDRAWAEFRAFNAQHVPFIKGRVHDAVVVDNLPKSSYRGAEPSTLHDLIKPGPDARKWKDFYYTKSLGDARNFRQYEPHAGRLIEQWHRRIQIAEQQNEDKRQANRELVLAGMADPDYNISRPDWTPGDPLQPMRVLFGAWRYDQDEDEWARDSTAFRFDQFTSRTGWYPLGSGNFSVVFGNDQYPNIVVKIGASGSVNDSAYGYTEWAMEHQGYHGVPTVHAMKNFDNYYIVVLDRLESLRQPGVSSNFSRDFAAFFTDTANAPNEYQPGGTQGWSRRPRAKPFWMRAELFDNGEQADPYVDDIDRFDMAALETWMLLRKGDFHLGSVDLHGGNLMKTKDGRIQLTDPFA